jgi:hypothetical protein
VLLLQNYSLPEGQTGEACKYPTKVGFFPPATGEHQQNIFVVLPVLKG